MPTSNVAPTAGVDPRGRRAQAAIGLGFVLLLLASIAAIVLALRTSSAERWVAHTLEVRQLVTRLSTEVVDAETSQRGFLLTDDPTYLAPLEQAKGNLPALITRLKEVTSDNPEQSARVAALEPLIARRMAVIEKTVSMRQQGKSVTEIRAVIAGQGRKLMDQIRLAVLDIDAEERALFEQRRSEAARERTLFFSTIILSLAVSVALGVFVARTVRRYVDSLEQRNASLAAEITQREQAQAQLRQAQKMESLGRLTGGVAHDFNNMLAIIVGSLDLLQRRLADAEPRIKQHVSNAMEGAKRASALTQRLLAFSRQQPLAPRVADINKCVTDMSQILHRTLGETVHIETVIGAGVWRASVDVPQLESAILNLAVNARDAMDGGGKLTLETSNTYLDHTYSDAHEEVPAGQYVLIAVTDTGAGMTPEVMARAFDPFFTTKPAGSGTGLGLSQVHGFIKQSGGHVKLYSEIGVGTTVKLYLPRNVGADDVIEPVVEPRREDSLHLTVLVVEDEDGVREFVTEALGELGHSVHQASNATEALKQLEAHPEVSLMLTDVVMPGINGRELADQAHARWPNLKVLFMTGYTRNAIVHNGVLDAGRHLISKPFTLAQLETELKNIVRGKSDA